MRNPVREDVCELRDESPRLFPDATEKIASPGTSWAPSWDRWWPLPGQAVGRARRVEAWQVPQTPAARGGHQWDLSAFPPFSGAFATGRLRTRSRPVSRGDSYEGKESRKGRGDFQSLVAKEPDNTSSAIRVSATSVVAGARNHFAGKQVSRLQMRDSSFEPMIGHVLHHVSQLVEPNRLRDQTAKRAADRWFKARPRPAARERPTPTDGHCTAAERRRRVPAIVRRSKCLCTLPFNR